jgi:hopene-associated glycosyltransferase HpnB
MTFVALLSAAVWAYLFLGRGGFWLARDRDDIDTIAPPETWPSVVAVIPARNEADVIGRVIGSLLRQDYAGSFRIVLVDDNSSDGTAAAVEATAREAGAADRVSVLKGAPLPAGWTGKLWALHQGTLAAEPIGPEFVWLSDADIVYAPDTLRSLVARAEAGKLSAVSLMARLNCESFAERTLIPAFIFFFQMLYPFRWVNDPEARTAAAAGGCVLARREALTSVGGVASIRGALIDDCSLAARLKGNGDAIWLGLTRRAVSIRPYPRFANVRAMVSRSAYAQLRFSPLLLLGTLLGLTLVYLAPLLLALFGPHPARWIALCAWAAMTLAFAPTVRFYGLSWAWSLLLPAIAACYMGFTLDSAVKHAAGRGGAWKGRMQAALDG